MHEQVTKEFGKRKYLNGRAQTPPFSYFQQSQINLIQTREQSSFGFRSFGFLIQPEAKSFRAKASASLLNSLKNSKLGLRLQVHDSVKALASLKLHNLRLWEHSFITGGRMSRKVGGLRKSMKVGRGCTKKIWTSWGGGGSMKIISMEPEGGGVSTKIISMEPEEGLWKLTGWSQWYIWCCRGVRVLSRIQKVPAKALIRWKWLRPVRASGWQ